jgi:hypothetical protein
VAKPKRNVVKEEPIKAVERPGSRLGPFMEDWGRLVIPLGVGTILAVLRLTGTVDNVGLGALIGLVVLAATMAGFGLILWQNVFPRWVIIGSIAAGVLFLAGAVVPFISTIYPGSPAWSQGVTRDSPEIPLGDLASGSYRVQIYAKSLADGSGLRTGEGQYTVVVAGKDLRGKFSDITRSTRGRRGMSGTVEDRHFLEAHLVSLGSEANTLRVKRLDAVIGPEITVSFYRNWMTPLMTGVLLALAMVWAVFLDGRFQEQTWRWRLSPWIGAGVFFLLVFHSSYEPAKMPGAALWSGVFGGMGGFLVGWILSLISRKVVGMIRTRF